NTTDLLSGVGPGVYTITVTDSVGCSVSLSDTIETYSPLNITATVTSTCFGGASGMIDVNVTGGMVPPAYAYTWSSLPGETTDVADQLGPGSYNVTVTSGPCTASQTYTVNSLAVVDSLSLATTYCSVDPSAVVCPVYGSATITAYQWGYDWGPVTGATGPTYASPVDSLNAVTLYWTGVDGCNYFTDDIAITLYTVGGAIQQVNVFSPNGDGQNDVFYPYTAFAFDGVNFMDEYDLKIFDRWGVEVFASTDLTVSWNGKKQNTGEAVADGIYYWVMNVFNHCTNEKEEVHSFVHVMR
ncbi:MAG TPA: gliding motility-associated C-terminal domain-containing protein, partial [Flavobacteriales bacterium]|nr:gliding motility-associated C-terminal domain-containing protein [Flavobacteriales bacterium]